MANDYLKISEQLIQIGNRLQNFNKRFEKRCGISFTQWSVLHHIAANPGISNQKLAGLAGLHPSTLTALIKILIRKDFIFMDSDSRDNRRKTLVITRAGQTVYSRTQQHMKHLINGIEFNVAASNQLITALNNLVLKV